MFMANSEKSLTRSTVETGLKVVGWVVVLGVALLGANWLVGKAQAAAATA